MKESRRPHSKSWPGAQRCLIGLTLLTTASCGVLHPESWPAGTKIVNVRSFVQSRGSDPDSSRLQITVRVCEVDAGKSEGFGVRVLPFEIGAPSEGIESSVHGFDRSLLLGSVWKFREGRDVTYSREFQRSGNPDTATLELGIRGEVKAMSGRNDELLIDLSFALASSSPPAWSAECRPYRSGTPSDPGVLIYRPEVTEAAFEVESISVPASGGALRCGPLLWTAVVDRCCGPLLYEDRKVEVWVWIRPDLQGLARSPIGGFRGVRSLDAPDTMRVGWDMSVGAESAW